MEDPGRLLTQGAISCSMDTGRMGPTDGRTNELDRISRITGIYRNGRKQDSASVAVMRPAAPYLDAVRPYV